MVDLDELDRLHAALPELSGRAQNDAWSPSMMAVVAEVPIATESMYDEAAAMSDLATNAVTILNAYPALAAELRALRERVAKQDEELVALRYALRAIAADTRDARGRDVAHVDDLRGIARAALAKKVPR